MIDNVRNCLRYLASLAALFAVTAASWGAEAFNESEYRKQIEEFKRDDLGAAAAPESQSEERAAAYYYALRAQAKERFGDQRLHQKLVAASPKVKKLAERFPASLALRALAFQYSLYPDVRLGDDGGDFARALPFCLLACNAPADSRDQNQKELAETFALWLSTMIANYSRNVSQKTLAREESLYFWDHAKAYPGIEDVALWKTLCLRYFKENDQRPQNAKRIKQVAEATPDIPERPDIQQCWLEMLQIADTNRRRQWDRTLQAPRAPLHKSANDVAINRVGE